MDMLARNDISPIFSKLSANFSSPALRVVTHKVAAVGGINLGQGTCQVAAPDEVIQGAITALQDGVNGYTMPRGLPVLRSEIARKLERHNAITGVDPETEVLVTCGVTGALEGLCSALIDPGDEVILFEPYYPYHRKTLEKYGAQIKYVTLRSPKLEFDSSELRAAFSGSTKFVLINTPGNPSGKVFTRSELLEIGNVCSQFGAYLVSDEIYEYMVFDGQRHVSPASIPELRPITLMMGGFSKTYAITGWRIGFLFAPADITEKTAQVIDLTYVCAPAPLQRGVASALAILPETFYDNLSVMYQRKRDFFSAALQDCGFVVRQPSGSYYIIADYSERFPALQGMDFVDHLVKRTRVGAVPANDFIRDFTSQRWVRFCVAVEQPILEQAGEWLRAL